MDKYNCKDYLLTEDGQFACKYCKGTKELEFPLNSNTKREIVPCWMCNGSGYMVDMIKCSLKSEIKQHEQTRKEFNKLRDWIQKTSKCTTCGGDSSKTFGGCPCKECTLIGTKPWGG